LEAQVARELGHPLPGVDHADEARAAEADASEATTTGFSEIFRPPYRSRTIMLAVFNFFQSIGYYGFGNWVPALIEARGIKLTESLQYSFLIAIVFPLSPLTFSLFADHVERKWQIVIAACGTAVFGLLFARQSAAALIITFGLLITFSNNLLSYSFHAYQAELFPTRMRARAVGFVYSFSRISTVLSSFLISFFLVRFGTAGVFAFIAAAMAIVVCAIAVFGPRTRGLALEEISR
jgi:putative MFS transporter